MQKLNFLLNYNIKRIFLCFWNKTSFLIIKIQINEKKSQFDVEKILKMFPDLTIIGAHFGGWSIWDKAPEILCKYKNLYVDTCSSFYALSKERVREIINLYGADRVIFGTDFPMWKQEDELKFLFSLGLSEEELQNILYNNLAKILNIK